MGLVADTIGARRGMAACLLVTTLPILGMMYVQDATGFIVCRGLIGKSVRDAYKYLRMFYIRFSVFICVLH